MGVEYLTGPPELELELPGLQLPEVERELKFNGPPEVMCCA